MRFTQLSVAETCQWYVRVVQSAGSYRFVNYSGSLLYVLPRLISGLIEVHLSECKTVLVFGSVFSSNKTVYSLIERSPKDYLLLLMQMLDQFGGVISVPTPYANALGKKGYATIKRPWGPIDFILSTDNLRTLAGSKYSRLRSYIHGLRRHPVEVRQLTANDVQDVANLEASWVREQNIKVNHAGFAVTALDNAKHFPAELNSRNIGVWYDGRLVGFAMACLVAPDTWANCYRFTESRRFNGLTVLMMQELAEYYRDYPYEADGDGRAAGSSLWEFKRRLLSEDVQDKQLEMYVVKRK